MSLVDRLPVSQATVALPVLEVLPGELADVHRRRRVSHA
jgi:hypothetical protein